MKKTVGEALLPRAGGRRGNMSGTAKFVGLRFILHPSAFILPLSSFILPLIGLAGLGAFGAGQAAEPGRPAAITTQNVPPLPAALLDELRRFRDPGNRFSGWSPAGEGMLVRARPGDTAQLYRVRQPGARPEPLTTLDEPVTGRFLRGAADGTLLISASQGGNENDQIYRVDPGAKMVLLSDGKSRNLLGPVRLDGSRLVFAGNERNGRDTDLFTLDPRAGADAQDDHRRSIERILQTNQEFWVPTGWSPDGARILIYRYVSINESEPAILQRSEEGEWSLRRLVPDKLPFEVRPPVAWKTHAFSPDGRSVYLTTDGRGEFAELVRLDLGTGHMDWLSGDIAADVTEVEVERQSGRVAFFVNQDGWSHLHLIDGDHRRQLALPQGIAGGLEFDPAGERLGFTLERPDRPSEAYSLSIANGTLQQWTRAEIEGLVPIQEVAPVLVRYPSFDDRMIPAFYFRPARASPDRPAPVLIAIHGGPESQYRPGFSTFDQYLLTQKGIAVLHPNVRGSAGYGKTYLQLDNAQRRLDSVRDIGALLDWIADQPELDAKRVAVIGASYGGYMVLASLIHAGERIRAGIDIVGIASFRTFLERTSAYRRDLRRAEYGDERDPQMQAFFAQIDPIDRANRIRSPLLVVHGRNDPRVPFFEAEQIVGQVRAAGRPVWTVYADNEGHGFARRENRDFLEAVIVQFLDAHLLAD